MPRGIYIAIATTIAPKDAQTRALEAEQLPRDAAKSMIKQDRLPNSRRHT